MPEGFLSQHLVDGLEPGTIVRLALPAGEFVLPDPPPARMLMLVGGSGITPVMSMLRTLDRRGTMPDVVVHYSSTTEERMIFRDEICELADRHDGLTLHRLHTDDDGMLDLADLDSIVPDWRERETWACGPAPMLDAVEEHWERAGLEDSLHLERFSLQLDGDGGEGGTLHVPELRQVHRGRRRDHRPRGRREGRRGHALRLPRRHLPHLHAHARQRHRARPAHRRRVRRQPTTGCRPA